MIENAVLSAGVVIVRREEKACRFLLLRAYNYWDFPKGEVEAGENPLDAALREVREETGIADLTFPWGNVFKVPDRGSVNPTPLGGIAAFTLPLPLRGEGWGEG